MEVFKFKLENRALLEQFISLTDEYFNDERHIKRFKESSYESLSETNQFFKNSKYSFFLIKDGDKPIARAMAFIDSRRAQENGTIVGNFGHFECCDNQATANKLLNASCDWLKKNGATHIHGPMDFNIYNNYRLMTEGFETSPFVGEPRNPRYYERLIKNEKFREDSYWRSWEINPSEVEKFNGFLGTIISKRKNTHEITMHPVDVDKVDEALDELYETALEIFKQNYGYAEVSKDEFVQIFAKIKAFLLPGSFQIAKDSTGKICGFVYGYVDMYKGFLQADGDLSKIQECLNYQTDRYIYHTFGVIKEMRFTDITARMSHAQTSTFKDIFPNSIAALTTSNKSIIDRIKNPNRRYVMYSKTL